MPKYRLIYFDLTGIAETSRLLFVQKGVEFEDVRVSENPEEWAQLKSTTPFGVLPVLEIDGEKICQSFAIERYLANEFDLGGKTNLEKAKVDMIVGCVKDVGVPLHGIFEETDKERKAEKIRVFKDVFLPDILGRLENLLKANNGGDGYFVGNEPTLADFAFTTQTTWYWGSWINYEVDLEPFPKLKALKQKILVLPRIVEWYQKRPLPS